MSWFIFMVLLIPSLTPLPATRTNQHPKSTMIKGNKTTKMGETMTRRKGVDGKG